MSKEQLVSYQTAENYLFHGSNNGEITEFEPRQALSFQKPDGEPAIFASASIEPAIFMAILGSRKLAGWDSSEFTKPFGFYISKSNWEQAQTAQWQGFVYVLNRAAFTKDAGWVWRAAKPIKPVDKVAVSFTDLPSAITILSDEDEATYVKRNS